MNPQRFYLSNAMKTVVNIGMNIKDIPKISYKDVSATLKAFVVVLWKVG